MSHNGLRLSVLGVALLLIAGCGGGSSTSSNSGGGNGSGSGGGNGGGNGGGPGDQATTITLSFITGPPTQVAVKMGSGSYNLENLTANKLTISVPPGTTTYSVAFLCPPFQQEINDTLELEAIAFGSVSDGTTFNGGCPGEGEGNITAPAMGNLTGTVDASAFPTASSAQIGAFSSNYNVSQDTPVGSFQISAPTGSDRVLLGLYGPSLGSLLAIKNFNNQTVPGAVNGGSTVAFGSSDATTQQPITYTNVPSGYGTPSTSVSFLTFLLASSDGTQYAQLPSGVLQSGDFYEFESSVWLRSGSQTSTLQSTLFPTEGGPVTLSFPAPWTTTGPAAASLPTLKFDYTGYAGKTGVFSEGSFTWTPASGPQYEILVTATQNYLGSATSLSVPDLSGVSGFLTPPPSGTSVAWFEALFQRTFPSLPSPAGGAQTSVQNVGSYVVP